MTLRVILWIYIGLMMAGGLAGFIKAKSKASLIASSIFSVILALFALDIFPFEHHVFVLIFLGLFFGTRLAKSKKFMPNGLMFVLTVLAFAAFYLLR